LLRKSVLCQSLPLCPTKIQSVREGIILFADHAFPYIPISDSKNVAAEPQGSGRSVASREW
jgi:hypothetical protein